MDIAALKVELDVGHPGPTSNPGVVAYNADDVIAADQINEVNRTRNRTSMTGDEILNQVDATDWAGLTAVNKQLVWDVVHLGEVDPFGVAETLLTDAFGGGSTTIIALAAARIDDVSRAVELGLGFTGEGHVAQARAL